LALLLAIVGAAAASTPGSIAEAEIAALLAYVSTSGCDFYRNGTWHDAGAARVHLEKKQNYLVNRSLVASAEDFIDRAATASSLSGETYLVRCAHADPMPSGDWLHAELRRLRAGRAAQGRTTGP
jgi:predicted RNA polymerase sigma factor